MESLICLVYLLELVFVLPHISNCNTLYYRIEPDDPGGPFYVRDKSINDTFIFEFAKFETNSKYQVILSFPGYKPIECSSNISQETVYDHKGRMSRVSDDIKKESRRRLLDTNIQTFTTGNRAIEQTIIKIIVRCFILDQKAFDAMIQSGAALKSHHKAGNVDIRKYIVQFGIKVESLWFGMIPNSLIGLCIAAVVVGLVIVLWITPFILRNIKPKHE